jgi:hypothetical protein
MLSSASRSGDVTRSLSTWRSSVAGVGYELDVRADIAGNHHAALGKSFNDYQCNRFALTRKHKDVRLAKKLRHARITRLEVTP